MPAVVVVAGAEVVIVPVVDVGAVEPVTVVFAGRISDVGEQLVFDLLTAGPVAFLGKYQSGPVLGQEPGVNASTGTQVSKPCP